jgi:hypothetical protein
MADEPTKQGQEEPQQEQAKPSKGFTSTTEIRSSDPQDGVRTKEQA